MSSTVKLTCRGTPQRTHPLRVVAQFRYDGGWARVHNPGERDDLLWEPTGELRLRHHLDCGYPQCTLRDVYNATGRLYALLDWARDHGKDEVPLG
jgi:hypothetical protein